MKKLTDKHRAVSVILLIISLLLTSTGCSKKTGRSEWFNDFFQAAKTTHKELRAFMYWQFPESGCEIETGDPCADDWYNEINGPDSAWWHSSIYTDSITGKIIPPPNDGCYLGVYNWAGTGVETFEQIIGRKVAIGDPYPTSGGGTENTWPSFNPAGHEQNWQAGYVTCIGIETGLGAFTDPKFIPQEVIDGKIDSFLIKMAQDIRDWGKPIFWMYPREPCCQPGFGYDGGGYGPIGDLTIEEALNQGYSDRAEYEDSTKLDGPERYVDMCQHIHDIMAPIASKITWVMGAIVARQNGAYTQWYPGDDYVDWHALDIYGGVGGEEPTLYFSDIIEPDWSEALSINPNKPVIIVEFGVYKSGGDNGD